VRCCVFAKSLDVYLHHFFSFLVSARLFGRLAADEKRPRGPFGEKLNEMSTTAPSDGRKIATGHTVSNEIV
jgi:hypothetical protein